MEYNKDLVIPETNKCLNLPINLSDYFSVIGCRLIMDCYVGHFVRDFFLKDPIIWRGRTHSGGTKEWVGSW